MNRHIYVNFNFEQKKVVGFSEKLHYKNGNVTVPHIFTLEYADRGQNEGKH